jgi:hypothetical protein
LAYFLSQQDDIQSVRLSRMSESIIITYDPYVWDAEALVTLIKAYNPDPAALERCQSAEYDPAAKSTAHSGGINLR